MLVELLAVVATRAATVAWAEKVAAAMVPALLLLSWAHKQHRGPIPRALRLWASTQPGVHLYRLATQKLGI